MTLTRCSAAATAFLLGTLAALLAAADQPQWGEKHTRNMVSGETGLPESFDPRSGRNVLWSVPLGSQSYATPIVSGGRVLIGTNNDPPRDARYAGDRGVLACFDEKNGRLLWQLVVPKLSQDPYLDWPRVGIVSPATVEGDRVYIVSNRSEVMCLDLAGQANGNDGIRDEGPLLAAPGAAPVEPGSTDADIIWSFDMRAGAGVYPHDAAHGSVLIDGDLLYVNTSNGVDNTHRRIRAPEAPSLIALEKATGRLVARDGEPIAPRIIHCTWSSPSLAEVGGADCSSLAVATGFAMRLEALRACPGPGRIERLKTVWRFDCDPESPKQDVHRWQDNRREGPSNISGMPVFHKNRVYVEAGGDVWHGRRRSWLKCIDATKTGDITVAGQVWSYAMDHHCMATPAVYGGLVFIVDCGRTIHCLDEETGRPYWTQATKGEIWSSPLVADGKVYVGTERGDFWILAAAKEKRVIA